MVKRGRRSDVRANKGAACCSRNAVPAAGAEPSVQTLQRLSQPERQRTQAALMSNHLSTTVKTLRHESRCCTAAMDFSQPAPCCLSSAYVSAAAPVCRCTVPSSRAAVCHRHHLRGFHHLQTCSTASVGCGPSSGDGCSFDSPQSLPGASPNQREAASHRFLDGGSEVGSEKSEKKNQPSDAVAVDSECGRGKRQKRQGWHSTRQ